MVFLLSLLLRRVAFPAVIKGVAVTLSAMVFSWLLTVLVFKRLPLIRRLV